MTTKLAYVGLILIWGTTPLAVKWSTEGSGYLFAIASRMTLGMIVSFLIIAFIGRRIPYDKRALQTYFASGVGIFTAMGSVYWGVQYIPSGWLSVVFGLSPIITGALAVVWLKEDALSPPKLSGIICAIVGLAIIFGHGAELGPKFIHGILAVLLGTSCHAASAVAVKRLDAEVGGFAITAGGLSVAVPLLAITWFFVEGQLPAAIPARAAAAIIYLGIIASAVGFALYYYVLRRMTASRVSLVALITPVIALFLGHLLNDEPLSRQILLGTFAIVMGLLIYQFGENLRPALSTFANRIYARPP